MPVLDMDTLLRLRRDLPSAEDIVTTVANSVTGTSDDMTSLSANGTELGTTPATGFNKFKDMVWDKIESCKYSDQDLYCDTLKYQD